MRQVYRLYLIWAILLLTTVLSAQHALAVRIGQHLQQAQGTERVDLLLKYSATHPSLDTAEMRLLRAKALAEKLQYQEGICRSYIRFCSLYSNKGDINRSRLYYDTAMTMAKTLHLKDLERQALREFQLQSAISGNLSEALELIYQANRIGDSLQHPLYPAQGLYDLGSLYSIRRHYEQSTPLFDSALVLLQGQLNRSDPDPREDLEDLRCNLLYTYAGSLITQEGWNNRMKALELFRLIDQLACLQNTSPSGVANITRLRGSLYVDLDSLEKGFDYLQRALDIYEQGSTVEGHALTYSSLAVYYGKKDDYLNANSSIDRAIELARVNKKNKRLQSHMLKQKAFHRYHQKDTKTAFETLLRANKVEQELINEQQANTLAQLQVKYETADKERQIAEQELELSLSQNRFNRLALIALTLFTLALGLFFWFQNRLKNKAREARRLQEIDELKTRLFTNVSHEFRTPLTLLLNALSPTARDREGNLTLGPQQSDMLHRNAESLHSLIDQMLDLSKLEAGKMQLQVTPTDLADFVRSSMLPFFDLAAQKQIHLELEVKNNSEGLYFDSDKMGKILSNLLSNAIKFTEQNGRVLVIIDRNETQAIIQIRDTGKGIDSRALPHIFNRFYQPRETQNQGTGIGLALVKELVDLHHGTIEVKSQAEKGTIFCLFFPLGHQHFHDVEISQQIPASNTVLSSMASTDRGLLLIGDHKQVNTAEEGAPIILLVEDNMDLQEQIRARLAKQYQVITASDGEAGIDQALLHIPDLIILDAMMPKKDGFAVCRFLKSDNRTDHIPVVMLTAKATQEDKVRGLSQGADAYLYKPFDLQELLVRIEQLIVQRRQLQEKYSQIGSKKPARTTVKSKDERFLNDLIAIIRENIDENNFTIEDFAQEAHMSRSQLHRKLKALTGQTPTLFLRQIRLERGKELLEQDYGNVSEVAYAVGFKDAGYFAKCFREAFGTLPKEVMRKVED